MPKVLRVFIVIILVLVVLIPLVLLGTCSVAGGVGSLFSGFTGNGILSKIWGVLLGAFLIFLGFMFWKLTVVLKKKGDEFLKKGDADDKA